MLRNFARTNGSIHLDLFILFAFPYSFLFVQYINDIRTRMYIVCDMRQLGSSYKVQLLTSLRGRQFMPLGVELCPNMAILADASAF